MAMLSIENHILVVADVEAIRSFMQIVLGKVVFKNVDFARDGQEVMHKTRQKHYHLVFLDINLPGSDGISILRWIRAKSPSTQVVMCSSSHSSQVVEETQNAGAIGFLEKPIVIKDFIALLQQLRLGEAI